jgi:hypothetical protein
VENEEERSEMRRGQSAGWFSFTGGPTEEQSGGAGRLPQPLVAGWA